jgi:hypothetical protein
MLRVTRNFERFHWGDCARFAAFAIFAIWVGGFPKLAVAQPLGQKTFLSPEEASRALFVAVQADDQQALVEIFGPAGKDIMSSGDVVENANSRHQFVQKYQEMHRLAKEPDGTTTLYIGAENWPLPIPLVNTGDAWSFDTETGTQEILFRRIGKNELAAMLVCHALVDAEKEYYAKPRGDNAVKQYAQRFVSDEGGHNGLYWGGADDEAESLIGPLLVKACRDGSTKQRSTGPIPFHGYYYRLLTSQGKHAPGGTKNYVVNGRMTRGFAFVAYPAEYRSSGVMTFIVNQDGIIYEKDLGPKTADIVQTLSAYDPDQTWQPAEKTAGLRHVQRGGRYDTATTMAHRHSRAVFHCPGRL